MNKIVTVALFVGICATINADVTINFQAFELRGFDGNPVSLDSKAVLVADTTGNGFVSGLSAFAGTSLVSGNLLGGSGDDLILGVFDAINIGAVGVNGVLGNISLSGGLDEGDALGLFWFPTISTNSIVGSVTEYGFYRSDTVDSGVGSSISYVVPADGGSYALATFDSNLGGLASVEDLTAVPEPATYALIFGVFSLAIVFWQRRRR